ncbi:MAG: lysophospholipid acyltransferase family protein [Acidobacteria bacterium]|nr:lysophospholipid acyltransferase family protein [Acidobacteriota bacterium]
MILVAWFRSCAAYVYLCLFVGLIGPPALLLAWATGWVRPLPVLGRFAAMTARQIFGIRVTVEGLDHVRADRPSVYCINHRSHVDMIVFELILPNCPKLRALYKAELNRIPVLGMVLRTAGFVPVERTRRDRAIEAVDLAVEHLKAGESFLLAPEGTRSRTDQMLPFKKGGFVMAIKAQVPVVPIAIIGSDRAMPRGRFYATPGRVLVRIGEPVPTTGLGFEDRDRLAADVRRRMEKMLGRAQ